MYIDMVVTRKYKLAIEKFGPGRMYNMPARLSDRLYSLMRDMLLDTVPAQQRDAYMREAVKTGYLRYIPYVFIRGGATELAAELAVIREHLFPLGKWEL